MELTIKMDIDMISYEALDGALKRIADQIKSGVNRNPIVVKQHNLLQVRGEWNISAGVETNGDRSKS